VIETVVDASVVIKWVTSSRREAGTVQARRLQQRHEGGELWIVVPGLLFLEILNVAGRSWGWPDGELLDLAETLGQMELEVGEPRLGSVAVWVGRGLTAYDAAYLALAEERGIHLITDDRAILETAGDIAQPLVAV
jgi:predicted nucleic acid-binding protein